MTEEIVLDKKVCTLDPKHVKKPSRLVICKTCRKTVEHNRYEHARTHDRKLSESDFDRHVSQFFYPKMSRFQKKHGGLNKAEYRELKLHIWAEDNYICFKCGEKCIPIGNLRNSVVMHHKDGNPCNNARSNLATMHWHCHTSWHGSHPTSKARAASRENARIMGKRKKTPRQIECARQLVKLVIALVICKNCHSKVQHNRYDHARDCAHMDIRLSRWSFYHRHLREYFETEAEARARHCEDKPVPNISVYK
jgi:predicted metal-binding protein